MGSMAQPSRRSRRKETSSRSINFGVQIFHIQSIESVRGDTITVRWEGRADTSSHTRKNLLERAVDAGQIERMIMEARSPASVSTESFGAALADRMPLSRELAAVAMVCCGWWKGARAVQQQRGFAIVWAERTLRAQRAIARRLDHGRMEELLHHDLVAHFQQLPQLEPDLCSPGLMGPANMEGSESAAASSVRDQHDINHEEINLEARCLSDF